MTLLLGFSQGKLNPTMFGGHGHCGIVDIMVLICQLIL